MAKPKGPGQKQTKAGSPVKKSAPKGKKVKQPGITKVKKK